MEDWRESQDDVLCEMWREDIGHTRVKEGDVTEEIITECDDPRCPLFGKPHWHCPKCGETLRPTYLEDEE